MTKFLNKNNIATIAGYLSAVFNALAVIDIDALDYKMPSTYLKLFGAVVMPIIVGHVTEFKKD